LDAEILTYSRAKGIFAGLALNGAAVHEDHDSMKAIYGADVTERQVLTGKVPPPASAQAFLSAVKGAKAEAKAQ
jgi:lipid-binding SYLF domain-containing protein